MGVRFRNGAAAQGEQETILKMAEEGWETPDSAFVYGYLSVYFPTATQEQLRPIARNLPKQLPEGKRGSRTGFLQQSFHRRSAGTGKDANSGSAFKGG